LKPANVGKLRERPTLQAQSQAVDSYGDIATTWADVATLWARFTPTKAAQVTLAGRDDAIREYTVTTRYRTDITTNSRLIWRGRKFDVRGVTDPTEQRQFIDVYVREINA